MKEIYIKRLSIENYDQDNVLVNVGSTHVFTRHTYTVWDEEGNQCKWISVMSMQNTETFSVAMSRIEQNHEYDSAYHLFNLQYKSLCKELNVEPLIC